MKFRPFILLLIVIGVVGGCQTQDPLISEARTSLQSQNFERAIELTDQAIAADSSNALAYYYRATALASLAEDIQPPSDRLPYYEDMRTSMDNAEMYFGMMENVPDEASMTSDVTNSVWILEHNTGIEYLIDEDSLRQTVPNPDEYAVQHFTNAVTVQPDSGITFIIMGYALSQVNQIDEAIEAYETGIERLEEPTVDDFNGLISLYMMEERFEDALQMSQQASEAFPDSMLFVEHLADAHLRLGQIDEGLEVVRNLVESNPENPNYYFVLGTQLYQAASTFLDEAGANYDQIDDLQYELRSLEAEEQAGIQAQIADLLAEAAELEIQGNELAEESIGELQSMIEFAPEDERPYNVLGIIYQNRASMLFDKRNIYIQSDGELADQFDTQAYEELDYAREYYEGAAEINPDNPQYWLALFQVYATLGMDAEAEAADARYQELGGGGNQ